MAADNLLQPFVPKGFAVGILGLCDAVRIKQEAVARSHRDRTNRICLIPRRYSKEQAVAFDSLQLTPPPKQERWVSRGGVLCPVILGIDPQIGCGDELTSK